MDDTFKKASEDLVSAVDSREKNPMDEYNRPVDLSREVERALESQTETIEKRGEVIIHGFPEEGPPYVALEKRFFLRELSASQEKIEKKKVVNKKLIDRLVEDIRNNFGYEADANQMEWEAFRKMIEQPYDDQNVYKRDFDRYKDPYQVLIDPYSYGLDEKPYGKEVIKYAFEKALENGDYWAVLYSPWFAKDVVDNYETLRGKALAQLFTDPDSTEALRFLLRFLETNGGNQESEEPKIPGALPGWRNNTEYKEVDAFEGISKTEVFYLCQRAVHEDPANFLRTNYGGNALKKLPQFERLIIEAYRSLNLTYQLNFLSYLEGLIPKGKIEALTLETAEDLLANKPGEIFRNYEGLSQYLGSTDDFLEEAANKKPEDAVYYYSQYRKSPQSKKIFQEAAWAVLETNYRKALELYNSSKETHTYEHGGPFPSNYEDELVRIGLERYPELILDEVLNSNSIKKRTDWSTVKVQAEKKVASIGPKKKEAVDILLRSIPKGKLFDLKEARLESALLQDPAIALYPLVDSSWESISSNEEVKTEISIIVLRNLINQGIPFSKESFIEGYRTFYETREKYKDVRLFEGKNVLVASHSDTYDKKGVPESQRDTFGRAELDRAVKRKQGTGMDFEHIEPKKKSFEDVKKSKERVLKAIEDFKSPMTFLFDGHGWEDAMYLSDGNIVGTSRGAKQDPLETELTIKITVDELSKALLARSRKGPDLTKDILILNMCSSYLFIRNLYKNLEKIGCPKPIAIAPSEYGQYGFSESNSTYGDTFWDYLMESETPSLGDFWDFDQITYENPSVFVPTKKGELQLADNDESPEARLN